MSGIEIPECPDGIGSIVRVVFKDPDDSDVETFYVEATLGLWVDYGSDGVDRFTWNQMVQIIEYDEAEVFEVVYEGLWASEMDDIIPHHIKDWIWREAL